LREVASSLVKSTRNPTDGIEPFEEKLSSGFKPYWNRTRWNDLRSFWLSVSNAGKEDGRALGPCAEERDPQTALRKYEVRRNRHHSSFLTCRIQQLLRWAQACAPTDFFTTGRVSGGLLYTFGDR